METKLVACHDALAYIRVERFDSIHFCSFDCITLRLQSGKIFFSALQSPFESSRMSSRKSLRSVWLKWKMAEDWKQSWKYRTEISTRSEIDSKNRDACAPTHGRHEKAPCSRFPNVCVLITFQTESDCVDFSNNQNLTRPPTILTSNLAGFDRSRWSAINIMRFPCKLSMFTSSSRKMLMKIMRANRCRAAVRFKLTSRAWVAPTKQPWLGVNLLQIWKGESESFSASLCFLFISQHEHVKNASFAF